MLNLISEFYECVDVDRSVVSEGMEDREVICIEAIAGGFSIMCLKGILDGFHVNFNTLSCRRFIFCFVHNNLTVRDF